MSNAPITSCASVTPLLDEARLGALPAPLQDVVAGHVQSCRSCRTGLETLETVASALTGLPRSAAPASILSGVRARLETPVELSASVVPGPFGPLVVAYSARGIAAVEFSGDVHAAAAALAKRTGRRVRVLDTPPRAVQRAVEAVLLGRRPSVAFDLSGLGDFERAVLEKTSEIPAGEVRPYRWIAREIGRPGAVRAVGQALGRNPIPLLIPCHRVVRNDGSLGGYAFGPDLKRRLLRLEGVELDDRETAVRAGDRLIGSRTTQIFCFPTCRNARRIRPEHRVTFRGEPDAVSAGYRPCRVCRPALVS